MPKRKGAPAPASPAGRGRGNGGAGIPAGASLPEPLPDHRSEPPPAAHAPAAPRAYSRRCAPPAAGEGKPPGTPGGDWTLDQWNSVLIDFIELDKLAATQAGPATAKARPNDPEFSCTRGGKPYSTDGVWSPDACTYCAFREVAPAGTPPDQDWWYGNGDGAHNPYRCQCFKRYLAEGGDVSADPQWVHHLRRCLRKDPRVQ